MCDQSTQFSAHSNMAEPVHGDEGRRNWQSVTKRMPTAFG